MKSDRISVRKTIPSLHNAELHTRGSRNNRCVISNWIARTCFGLALLGAILPFTPVCADLNPGYSMEELPLGSLDGQFTVYNGDIHYWSAFDGYRIYNVASGESETIGKPPGGTGSNNFGDPFGVFDPENQRFYAATLYNWSDSMVYTYDHTMSDWLTPGPNGVYMVNAYGAQAHNGRLYVSGLAEPWDGGYGQTTFIFAFDQNATPDGDEPRHDMLIETSGNSANVAIAPNGDVYYGVFSPEAGNQLFRWTGAQVAAHFNKLYDDPPEEDTFLTLDDAVESWDMPGGGNGIAVDAGGNVFFAVNDFSGMFPAHTLGMLDPSAPEGYREIYTDEGYNAWFGPISVDGDFLRGGTLYFSPYTFGDATLIAIKSDLQHKILTVVSEHGGAYPGTVRDYENTTLTQSITNSPVAGGSGTQYVCVGASVEGNDFTQVNATNVELTLTDDATLTWQWQTQYQLTTTTTGKGSVLPAAEWYAAGSNATLTATAAAGWYFAEWSGNTNGCDISGNTITAPMDGPRTIKAKFKAPPFKGTVISIY